MQMTLVQRIQHSEPGANEEDGMYISICLSICQYMYVCMCMYACIRVCVCVYMCVCVFILLNYYSRGFSLPGEVSISV